MSCHLHQLIESAAAGRVSLLTGGHKMPNFFMSDLDRAICFHLGEIDSLPYSEKFSGELVKLPYPACWFEFLEPGIGTIGFLATEEPGGEITFLHFLKLGQEWAAFGFAKWTKVSGIRLGGGALPALEPVLKVLLWAVAAINCVNVRQVNNFPSDKLQKARQRRGKKPLFSYWTLDLDLQKYEKGEWQGGTHASPRVHLRRGHIAVRRSGPYAGKAWWVQPHIVRGDTPGMVHKDYRVAA